MNTMELAKKLGVSPKFVSQIELGRCPLSNSDELLQRLAKALNLDVNQLQAFRLKRRLKKIAAPNPLSEFLVARRLELHLTQCEVGERVGRKPGSVISNFETGKIYPTPTLLEKIAQALNCQIPTELMPPPKPPARCMPTSNVSVWLSDQNSSDLNKIKELSGIKTNSETIRKALMLLRRLLEKQRDGYTVFLRKDQDVRELDLIL